MADAIVRLKVESQEFDNKLARATQQLQHMEKECRNIGGTFEYVDKEQLDLVKSLGQMETKATSARGKVAEMTKSYTDLSMQYKRLTDEEKKSPFGKAMAQSLDQLKSRIKDANKELKQVNAELGDSSTGLGGILDSLAGKLGIPTGMMTKLGVAVAAAGAAVKVAKDTFNASEATVDAWGRTVESATSIYEGFVTSLNTGDFSGFISNINNIISAARSAYDELDRLGTMKTIQGPEMSRQEAENNRNRGMLQTRRYIAPLDGSVGIPGMKTGDLLSDAQVKQIEKDLQDGIRNLSVLIENEVKQTTNAIDAEYEKQAQILGMTVEEFRKGTSSMAEFDKMIELAKKYYEFEKEHTTFTTMQTSAGAVTQSYRDDAVNPYAGAEKWNVFRVDGEAYNNLVNLIKQRDQQMSQAYSNQAQAYRTINRVEGITARGGGAKAETAAEMWEELQKKIKEAEQRLAEFQEMADNTSLGEDQRNWAKGMVETTTEELNKLKGIVKKTAKEVKTTLYEIGPSGYSQEGIAALKKQIQDSMKGLQMGSAEYIVGANNLADLATFEQLIKEAVERGFAIDPMKLETIFEKIDFGVDIPQEEWDALIAEINEQLKNLGIDPIKIGIDIEKDGKGTEETAKKTKEAWGAAANAVQAIGGALQQIEDPSAKVAGIIMEAVANIALGFAMASAQSAKGGVFGWIAATIGGLATMISTISAIKSVTKGGFANGGIVPGNSFSGDNLHTSDYGINSGELILNRSQQNVIASQLQGGAANIRVQGFVKGHDILLAGSNYALQTGKAVKGLNGYALPIIAG